jgi:imidazolonepropionase-like amidohydrolase
LTGGRVVVEPGQVLDPGTIVIRDGLIEAVGRNVVVPNDARVWDMAGRTIYAGFIDPYLALDQDKPPASNNASEFPEDAIDGLRAGGIRFYGVPGGERDPGASGPGSELAPISPERRIVERLAPPVKTLQALRDLGFAVGQVISTDGIMPGSTALIALSDENPNETVLQADVAQQVIFATGTGPRNAYPRSLMGVIAAVRQTFLDADFYRNDWDHYQDRPDERRRPGFNPAWAALGPVLQDSMPVLFEPGSVLMSDRAIRIAREHDLNLYVISCGEEWRRPDLVAEGRATFIVPLRFPEVPRMPEEEDWDQVSLDQLRAWDWAPENAAVLRRAGCPIALTSYGLDGASRKNFRKKLRLAIDRGLSEDDALAGLTTIPARICRMEDRLGTIARGKMAHLTVVDGTSYFDPKARVEAVWIDGRHYAATPETKSEQPKDKEEMNEAEHEDKAQAADETAKNSESKPDHPPRTTGTARSPLARRGPLAEPPAVLVRDAVIWTCGPQGMLEHGDLLIVDGKVARVGSDLSVPRRMAEEAVVIDAAGRHVTPGLIDAHSHSMILGSVNEGTIPSSAMVRIGDVVNSETANIYWQLAGGLTVANLLHGSANPIGGQNAIIKLRDGAKPETLILEGAPRGIKFALGENVKQSNWGADSTTRFPQTRMGVPSFIANRFTAATQYLRAQQERSRRDAPLRVDLELEALAEILQSRRWIHCHSYRQDEILAFLRLMESFEVQVGTLQHVLEGYKVADEIARHGAGGSCFSDWWAYKYEVLDAIPYAGSLMHERGVLVSFNSDSSDHARRLHLEAAKAVKYGGTPPETALAFVTINPARQLRIEQRVGSLEPGKDGDFVLWSQSPLDSRTRCLQTWIEGRKYFDIDADAARGNALREERNALLAKARALARPGKGSGDEKAEAAFFHLSLEHQFDGVDRHCMEHEHETNP